MVNAYVHGASTRDVGQITEALTGEHVSKSTVSRAAKTLGTKVEELRKAPIEGPAPRGDHRRRGVRELVERAPRAAHRARALGRPARRRRRPRRHREGGPPPPARGAAAAVHRPPPAEHRREGRGSGRGLPRRSGRSSWRPPRPRPAGGCPNSPPVSDASSQNRWRASTPASRRPPSSTHSRRSTGTASARPTGSSDSTVRSSVELGPWAPFRTARARSGSSPRSRSRSRDLDRPPLPGHVPAEGEGGRRRQSRVKQTRSFTASPFYTEIGT